MNDKDNLYKTRRRPADGFSRRGPAPRIQPCFGRGMLIVALILILFGSLVGAAALWLQGASFWGVLLGYVGGGWAGLIMGAVLMALTQALARLRRAVLRSSSAKKRSCQHQ